MAGLVDDGAGDGAALAVGAGDVEAVAGRDAVAGEGDGAGSDGTTCGDDASAEGDPPTPTGCGGLTAHPASRTADAAVRAAQRATIRSTRPPMLRGEGVPSDPRVVRQSSQGVCCG